LRISTCALTKQSQLMQNRALESSAEYLDDIAKNFALAEVGVYCLHGCVSPGVLACIRTEQLFVLL
jgi:hypothetical protein